MNEPAETPPPSDASTRKRVATSRVLVVILFSWIGLFVVAAVWVSLQTPKGAELRRSPFHQWDGVWEGEFERFDAQGERIAHLRVRQRYRHVVSDDRFRQEGHFTMTDMATGETRREKALKTAEFDGTGLERRDYRRKGSVVEHYDGVKEEGVVTWTRDIPGAKETIREWIEGETYYLEGEGVYGDPATAERITFRAEFQRIEED